MLSCLHEVLNALNSLATQLLNAWVLVAKLILFNDLASKLLNASVGLIHLIVLSSFTRFVLFLPHMSPHSYVSS